MVPINAKPIDVNVLKQSHNAIAGVIICCLVLIQDYLLQRDKELYKGLIININN